MFAIDKDSERATSIEDYQQTCVQFIEDISNDYKDWVNRYKLQEDEHNFRIEMIDYIVKNTNLWIIKYGDTIKKIDIIKDDGLSKMAGFTAGYPFKFHIYVNDQELYVSHKVGKIRLDIIAEASKENRMVRVTNLRKDEFANILSSADVRLEYDEFKPAYRIYDSIILDASNAKPSDIISITLAVEELNDKNIQIDKRGLSIIIRLI
ncbi:MAG: hypothetical protein KatS3mg003_1575 [Candidatus Nitrosocaldaceae archaeon]|nr:MAG: hypothetical protein KatS3mg003_1575 [Candidatus Nitrosocaldaceae archaeon]